MMCVDIVLSFFLMYIPLLYQNSFVYSLILDIQVVFKFLLLQTMWYPEAHAHPEFLEVIDLAVELMVQYVTCMFKFTR